MGRRFPPWGFRLGHVLTLSTSSASIARSAIATRVKPSRLHLVSPCDPAMTPGRKVTLGGLG